jgi:NAD+ synthase
MEVTVGFHKDVLRLDPAQVTDQLVARLRQDIHHTLRRRGAVVGISGGIDSAVVLALGVRACGPQRVLGLIMPERDSSPESTPLAQALARHYGVESIVEDITEALEGLGCYRRRDEAIARVFPEFDPSTYQAKIVLPSNVLDSDALNVFHLTIISPDGREKSERIPLREYWQIVAASNFKQRTRMALLYYHAEARNYAVVGTSNKNEHGQGFFVKYGDGGADVQPIAHLFKMQIYQIAEYLGVPEEIQTRPPTTDTYSAECTQEEFFFRLPFELMDVLWYAQEHEVAIAEVARTMTLSEEQVQRAFDDFERKQRTTEYLRMMPIVYQDKMSEE